MVLGSLTADTSSWDERWQAGSGMHREEGEAILEHWQGTCLLLLPQPPLLPCLPEGEAFSNLTTQPSFYATLGQPRALGLTPSDSH